MSDLSKNCIRLIFSAEVFRPKRDNKKERDKVADQKELRENEKGEESSVANFDIFNLRRNICKMKLPILFLCVAVLYGVCRIYAEEDVNLETDVADFERNLLKYEDLLLKESLSRQTRSLIPSPLNNILNLLGKNSPLARIVNNVMDLSSFIMGVLSGNHMCPKVEVEISVELIKKIVTHPISTIKTIICYVVQKIGDQGRAIMLHFFQIGIKFVKTQALPALHNILNTIKKTGLLPPSINALIDTFDTFYKIMNLMGMVG